MAMAELLTQLGTAITGMFMAYAMFQQYVPDQLPRSFHVYTQKLIAYFYPYIQITFEEFANARLEPSEAYTAIRDYLSTKSTKLAKRFKADVVKNCNKPLVLNMAENEEVEDEFEGGIKVWWASNKTITRSQSLSLYPSADEKRYYQLTFHRRHREIVTGPYIDHVLKTGKDMAVVSRQRKLYTNNPSKEWDSWRGGKWSHVMFEHPANFETLAMETGRKEELIKDLTKFSKGKEYYKKIGKAWKRGYLLYGPPGTGKSTMIAAIANFMEYDVYDLELTTVKNNSELRKLLIGTTSKSVIVIEDIDCSVDFTDKRKSKKEEDEEEKDKDKDPVAKKRKEDEKENGKKSEVTLSGLLNFIDGIWSACGGEKIIIFTTNYVEKLDPALIRRGRMDKHIEMSYCRFEAFRVLAKNYLDVESHQLFPKIEQLLQEVEMTPADVAENLMPKSEEEDEDACLKSLVSALEEAKVEARRKSEEEELAKLEKGEEEEENGVVEVVEAFKEDDGTSSSKGVKENGVVAESQVVK